MCTRDELIAYLQKLPEDTTIEVLRWSTGLYSSYFDWTPLDLEKYSDNCNLYGTILYLGED